MSKHSSKKEVLDLFASAIAREQKTLKPAPKRKVSETATSDDTSDSDRSVCGIDMNSPVPRKRLNTKRLPLRPW